MSAFALALLGFLFGWGLCAICLTAVAPVLWSYITDTSGPQKINNVDWLSGSRLTRKLQLRNEASVLARLRLATVRRRFSATIFIIAASVCCAEILQLLHVHPAFEFEEFLTEPRFAILATAASIGFAIRAYRRETTTALSTLLEITLVSGINAITNTGGAEAASAGRPKAEATKGEATKPRDANNRNTLNYIDSRFPWFVEVGLFASIVVSAVLLIDPQLLRNLTSFKAGSLEAHFAAAGGTATVQSGLIVQVDPSRKTTTRNWASFVIPHTSADPRYLTYSSADIINLLRSESFFEDHLKPLFIYLQNLDTQNKAFPYDAQQKIRRIASQYATMILDYRTNLKGNSKPALILGCVDEPAITMASQNQYCADEFGRRLSVLSLPDKWDPYIVQAVGDLLFVVWDRRHQEDFLVAAADDELNKDTLVCPTECNTAGELSLMYDLVVAKVRSERPWPFEAMLSELKKALQGIDAVLSRNDFEWRTEESPELHDETERLFRRNRLIDLTIGLELFYQRALSGQHFSPEQLQTWRTWLAETQGVLDLVDNDNGGWPAPFVESALESWRKSKEFVRSDASLMQDALLGSALSLTLVDASDGGVSPRDCLAARSLLDRARKSSKGFELDAGLGADDRGTYEGFLEQVRLNVESRCQP